MATARLFTRREIEGLIAAGNTIVIKEQAVLRLDAWKSKHPGGDLVIEHMIGRDATDEINMYMSCPTKYPVHITQWSSRSSVQVR